MRYLKPILIAGLAAGTLDIIYAILAYSVRDVPAVAILQSVASGILGRDAYSGGAPVAALGLTLHMIMAIVMAAGYLVIARVDPKVHDRPMVSGLVYGLFLFALMNFVVVPYSNAYPGNFPEGWYLAGAIFAHTILVGLPIAFLTRKFLKPGTANQK